MAVARRGSTATDLALIAVFAALIAVLSLVPAIPVGVGVPITLQTLGVALAGLTLGPVRGFLSVLLYLVVGFAGLPVFAGGNAGLGVLAKPSAGYLLSFPLAALIAGGLAVLLARHGVKYWKLFVAGIVASFVVVHPLGIAGMMMNLHLPLRKAVFADMVYWPGDVAKNLIAAGFALTVRKAFPRLVGGRVRHEEPATA